MSDSRGRADDVVAGRLHPIGVVSKRTGISLHVLRAWERRYGVVEPKRTQGGQRLYSDDDIARLRLLRRLTDGGRNISQVASLTDEELTRLAVEDAALSQATQSADERERYRRESLRAAMRLDADTVHTTLMRAVVSLRPAEFLEEVLLPLLQEVGDRWHAGELSPAQEHVVSMSARRVVLWLIDAYDSEPTAPVVLVTTVAGELHEFGALMACVVALDEGWRVTYLGTSLPAPEIARAARLSDATVVALSVVNTDGDGQVIDEVGHVRGALPSTVRVVTGGAGAEARRALLKETGAEVLSGSAELRTVLRTHRDPAERPAR